MIKKIIISAFMVLSTLYSYSFPESDDFPGKQSFAEIESSLVQRPDESLFHSEFSALNDVLSQRDLYDNSYTINPVTAEFPKSFYETYSIYFFIALSVLVVGFVVFRLFFY